MFQPLLYQCATGILSEGQITASIPYDHLIVAAGVGQSYFGHDEFAQYAPGMKTISDVLTIRRRVFGAVRDGRDRYCGVEEHRNSG